MFRFTIREVVLVTVVAAIGVAWWLDHSRQAAKNYSAEMSIWRFRADVLKGYIEAEVPARVVYSTGVMGEEVHIHDVRGPHSYYDSRSVPVPKLP